MKKATVLLAEDHPTVAEQLRQLLQESFEVVAVVAHGEALVKAAGRLLPDVVVTDISMPGMDGLQAAKELRSRRPSQGIVFITVHDDAALARKALGIGLGYVLKGEAGEQLIDAVNAALRGEPYVSSSLGIDLYDIHRDAM
ncbi:MULTISPECIES: response regulator [Dyella]|uniref:Response regulator transcription factor n=2 Tax=Dyella TaxID=231454 RepID=A0A4R0Z3G9_9GAMM|nr:MULTISPECIES: response regulator transcription factor [Dyella]TBR39514.1 response regulator transcription factor [Dyella terrae]TCI12900.1 response regulator transcription factor [Dyella soli]